MKRIATVALSALLVAGSMTSVASAQTYNRDGRGQQSQNDRGRDNDRRDNDRRDNDRRDRRDWNARSDNGFYAGGRWYYGQPSAAQRNRADFRPGYQQWRRGERLPASYRGHYRQVDYRREHLRAPPRGYHYVRTDRGDTLLVAIATGVILSVLANN